MGYVSLPEGTIKNTLELTYLTKREKEKHRLQGALGRVLLVPWRVTKCR